MKGIVSKLMIVQQTCIPLICAGAFPCSHFVFARLYFDSSIQTAFLNVNCGSAWNLLENIQQFDASYLVAIAVQSQR